ncbi:MAG: hypothetical protein PVG78_16625 [Desulfobacterales bacterium]|jgi:hypothetical protein
MENQAGNRSTSLEYMGQGQASPFRTEGGFLPGRHPFLTAFTKKNQLLAVPDGALFVWDGTRDIEIGVILQLGMEGLVFEYFDLGWVMAEAGLFDLLTDAGMCISAIPYRLLSDESIEDEPPSPVPLRRARVCFGDLHPAKKTALETLMSIYGRKAMRGRRRSGSAGPHPNGRKIPDSRP